MTNIQTINSLLAENLTRSESKENAKDVNFIQAIDYSTSAKISVICEYNSNNNDDEFYYGLHPSFKTSSIFESYPNTFEKLNDFMHKSDNAICFTLEESQSEYKYAMYAKTLIKVASNFRVSMLMDKSIDKTFLVGLLKEWDDNLYSLENGILSLFGIVPDEFLHILDKYYGIEIGSDSLSKRILTITTKRKESKTFSEFFYDNEMRKLYFLLPEESVFYSGVMPRLKKIEPIIIHGVKHIKPIKLHISRTTFATLDAIDNSKINTHPLLANYKRDLDRFDEYEDALHAKLVQNLLENTNLDSINAINAINEYLEHSYNSNTIAVSANLLTSDGLLLIGERNVTSIDKGSFYCSVNGQSEIIDNNVDFYKLSAVEDYPTLDIFSNTRIDFINEIARETNAELGTTPTFPWNCYGLSILGIDNRKVTDRKITKRRMHFNILFKNELSISSFETKKYFISATECFENKSIQFLDTRFYKGRKDEIYSNLKDLLASVYNASNEISAFLLVLTLIANFVMHKLTSMDIISIINIIIALIFILFFVIKVYDFYAKKASIKVSKVKITISKSSGGKFNKKSLEQFLNNLDLELNNKAHPILKLMFLLFACDLMNNEK